ncbi:hypothetical protein PTKU15_93000 [Paraburkholderia terrae]|nr:hypothetical protein PTKU15_93000 [Paraburkholderia terrae]
MQEASVTGIGNTVVQIVGDGNRVTAGYPHLTLTRYLARRQIRQDLAVHPIAHRCWVGRWNSPAYTRS